LQDLTPGLKEEKVKHKKVKDGTIYMAYTQYGYRMKEIAEYLGVHYATVSRSVMRVEQQKN